MQSERSAVKRGVSMKSIYIAATLLIFSLLTGCSNPASDSLSDTIQENNQKISESAEENSEIKIVHSREDATHLLAPKWEIKEPSALPDGYTKMDYYVYVKTWWRSVINDVTIKTNYTIVPVREKETSAATPISIQKKKAYPAKISIRSM